MKTTSSFWVVGFLAGVLWFSPVSGQDCADVYCGNGICEPDLGENCDNCSADCPGDQGGNPHDDFCCGADDGSVNGPVDCSDDRCRQNDAFCRDAFPVSHLTVNANGFPQLCRPVSIRAFKRTDSGGVLRTYALVVNEGGDPSCSNSTPSLYLMEIFFSSVQFLARADLPATPGRDAELVEVNDSQAPSPSPLRLYVAYPTVIGEIGIYEVEVDPPSLTPHTPDDLNELEDAAGLARNLGDDDISKGVVVAGKEDTGENAVFGITVDSQSTRDGLDCGYTTVECDVICGSSAGCEGGVFTDVGIPTNLADVPVFALYTFQSPTHSKVITSEATLNFDPNDNCRFIYGEEDCEDLPATSQPQGVILRGDGQRAYTANADGSASLLLVHDGTGNPGTQPVGEIDVLQTVSLGTQFEGNAALAHDDEALLLPDSAEDRLKVLGVELDNSNPATEGTGGACDVDLSESGVTNGFPLGIDALEDMYVLTQRDTPRIVRVDPEDSDFDGVMDLVDDCPSDCLAQGVACSSQPDADADGVDDACDNCPATPNGPVEGTCWDGPATPNGGPCEVSSDCPLTGICQREQQDLDGDGVGNVCDNCWKFPNPGQEDCDGDGRGDACDVSCSCC